MGLSEATRVNWCRANLPIKNGLWGTLPTLERCPTGNALYLIWWVGNS